MLFRVKVKVITVRKPGKLPETKAMSSWLEPEKSYPVFDVLKYRTKIDEGNYHINTLFLVGDEKTGRLDWIDGDHVLYAGEGNESNSKEPSKEAI